MTKLHDEIEKVATDQPALVLTVRAVEAAVLNSLRTAAAHLIGKSVGSGMEDVEIRVKGISVDPNTMTLTLTSSGGQLWFELAPQFSFSCSLHVAGDTALEFSEITYTISSPLFLVSGVDVSLKIAKPICQMTSSLIESASRPDALNAIAGHEKDLERLEGALTFLFHGRLVDAIFGQGIVIDLKEMFPGLKWQGDLRLELILGVLVIIPMQAVVSEAGECQCGSVGDLGPVVGTGPSNTTDLGGNATSAEWDLSVTVPAPPVVPISIVDGIVGIYLPQPVLNARFGRVFPAVYIPHTYNGFLGYNMGITVAFKDVAVSVDIAKKGIVIAMTMFADGHLNVTVEVPCVGPTTVAYTRVLKIADSKIEILLRPTVNDGVLTLRSDLQVLKLGKVTVEVHCLVAWLALAGGYGAVIGFVLDRIIDQVLMHNVPIQLRRKIVEKLNDSSIPLVDLNPLVPFLKSGALHATYSGKKTSVLVGEIDNY